MFATQPNSQPFSSAGSQPDLNKLGSVRHDWGLAEVQALGAELQRQQIASVVIDSEAGPLQLGMASEMATALGARYLRLEDLDAERLAGAVRQARA
jgi:magnesium chelatase subunit D